MKMEYKLLDNGTGVILTRQPEFAEGELYITFADTPSEATAIFEVKGGNSYYRLLSDGLCSLPASKLVGEVKVTVAVLNGKTPPQKWICEEFKVSIQKNGVTLIAPNDMNLPQTVVALKLENQEIRQSYKKLEEQYAELKDTLEKIMEGYDLT